MKTTKSSLLLFASVLCVMPLLSACSVESKSWVNDKRVEIHEDQFNDTFETASLDDATLRAIAVHYNRFGNGPLLAEVSYDPKSRKNGAGAAKAAAKRIDTVLRQNGVHDVQIGTTPVNGSGDVSKTLVTFAALTAHAPAGCPMMPGYNGFGDMPENADGEPDYRYGCTVETLIARQVTRPSDLLGKSGFETDADGHRQTNVMSRGYYGLKSNPDLDGESASDN